MDAERWARIEELCEAALALPPDARGDYLRRACGDDVALREEVESLARELDAAPDFLESPLIDRLPGVTPGDDEPLPTHIGACRVIRLLGRGGMGEVYLGARDVGGLSQEVAIKVIRRGMDTDEVLRRFRLEQRILASLHHPNIAALLDAGATADGRPFFVMEYVAGTPITTYCDEHKLSIVERIRLFQGVAQAVAHAHQRLVVHRDLKPRNILVSKDGVPTLLDFGIGKVLAPTDALGTAVETHAELRLLTPEYAAPEQITGGTITTATDVFALGVLLYELLAGRHPFAHGRDQRREVEAAICEGAVVRPSQAVVAETPPAPPETSPPATPASAAAAETSTVPSETSRTARMADEATAFAREQGTSAAGSGARLSAAAASARATHPEALRRTLTGDLDTIVLMALRPEPERRYTSVPALVEDLQRYLDARPVRARADTLGYRTRKFVRRNAGAVVAGTALAAALIATSAVTFIQSQRVAREAARAERERDQALEVRGFLLEMFGASGADQAVGDTVTARALLDRQVAQVDVAYRDRPALRADMLEVLADGYDRLGLYADAEPLARRALDARRAQLGNDHPDVASSLNLLGWIRHERGESREAEPLLLEALRIRRAGGERLRGDLSRTLNDLGVTYNATRRFADAEAVLREALDVRRALFGDAHRAVGITANNLAAAFYFQQKVDSAIVVQGLAVRALEESVGRDHQRSVVALSNLATFELAKGDLAAAESNYRVLLERQTRLQGLDHPVTARVVLSLANVVGNRGQRETSPVLLAEADSLYRIALATLERRLGREHAEVGQALYRHARVLGARGEQEESKVVMARALPVLQKAFGDTNRFVREARAWTGGAARTP